ncbi:hypothetical protein CsSME_00003358 [Camellia sinensis var. sinensis]
MLWMILWAPLLESNGQTISRPRHDQELQKCKSVEGQPVLVSLPPVTRKRRTKASSTVQNTPSSPARSSPLNSPESMMTQILENLADMLLALQRSMDTIATTIATQGTTLAAQGNTLVELQCPFGASTTQPPW